MLSKKTLSLATFVSVMFVRSKRMTTHTTRAKLRDRDWIDSWMFKSNLHKLKRMSYYQMNTKSNRAYDRCDWCGSYDYSVVNHSVCICSMCHHEWQTVR